MSEKRKILGLLLVLIMPVLPAFSQHDFIKKTRGGVFSLGNRTTLSTFNDGKSGNRGMGAGGQFRLQLSNRLNTEWFADYLTGNEGTLANRVDAHIGWSVMYYLAAPKDKLPLFQPYILAGHCFDYAHLEENLNKQNYAERWSSAVQAGTGMHYNLSQRFDLSATIQYMIHLGTDIHAEQQDAVVTFVKETGLSLEGHLLFNLSLNYKIIDLW